MPDVCDRQTAETWERLPQSSRNVLFQIALRLSQGFSGEFRIYCTKGGVNTVKQTQEEEWKPGDIDTRQTGR